MKRLFAALAAGLVCTASCIAQQASHLQMGAGYFRTGDYAQALDEFKQAEVEHPHDAATLNLLGITETKLGDLEKANSYYLEAIEANAALLSPHKNLAVNYLASGDYAHAEEQLKVGLKLNSGDPFLHFYLANLYVATSRDPDAVAQLEPAKALIGNDAGVLYGMAAACIRLHLDAKAKELIADGERKSLFNVGQEYQLALLLSGNGLYADATERFQQIVKVQPASRSARTDLAIALLNNDRAEQALPILEKLAAELPGDANVQGLLGVAYDTAGDRQKALVAYQAAVTADPANPDRYLDASRLLMDLDRYREAEAVVQAGLAHSTDTYALLVRKGSIEMQQASYAAARQSFQTAIQARPEISLGYYALAQCAMKENHDQEALDALSTAEANAAPDAKIDYLKGIILSHLGKRDEAVASLRMSIALDDSVAESHYELGRQLLDAGQLEPAKKEFERVIAITPQHPNAFYELSKIYSKLGDKESAARMAQETQTLLADKRSRAVQAQKANIAGFQEVHQE